LVVVVEVMVVYVDLDVIEFVYDVLKVLEVDRD